MSLYQKLSELIEIPSVYPDEAELAKFIEQELKDLGFEVNRQRVSETRFNLLAEKGEGDSLLIFGHLDTVALQEGWETDPFVLTIKGDRLYGLGAWDMKSGLAAVLSALKTYDPKKISIKLAFVVDEEYYSVGMDTLAKSGWLRNTKAAIISEPGFIHGIKGIALGRIGRSVYNIRVQTKGGHIYLSKDRANAISETAKIIQILELIPKVKNEYFGDSSLSPRFITGGEQSMSIPHDITLEMESQLVPPQTSSELLKQIQSLIEKNKEMLKAKITVDFGNRPTPFAEPFIVDKNNPYVTQITDTLKDTLGHKPVYYYRRSVGDENRLALLGIPVVTVGPDGDNAHLPNEWVSEKSLKLLEQFYINLLANFKV